MRLVIGSIFIGLVIGFLGQRSRMCFIGGFRDFLLVKDKELLKGTISFFVSAWLTIYILNLIGYLFPILKEITNVKLSNYPSISNAFLSKFGAISIIGGFGIGLFSTLSGGCPLRQHVLAGQGRVESIVYLTGFYIGIVTYYLLIVRFIGKLL
jgi:uncharacterized membrane protein YedE/YeeE